ncbi:MAG: WG repeat-containing protein [Bacteroidetes bacterium]|nr:MAG: WG repeat-containing protein [Bacteroidota bacterium]
MKGTWFLISLLLLFGRGGLTAQSCFPIKKDKKWGLINAEGKLVVEPVYEAIGEFKQFGYAVMQRAGGVGLINNRGEEVIPPKFEDLKVLDSTMVAVVSRGHWVVLNLAGNVILKPGYDRAKALNAQWLAYEKDDRWGVVDVNGRQLVEPLYDDIEVYEQTWFLTRQKDGYGLLTAGGRELLKPENERIIRFNDQLFFFQKDHRWGAVNIAGKLILKPEFDRMVKISDHFFKLLSDNKAFLFSIDHQKTLTRGQFDAYYPLTDQLVICKKNRLLGLIHASGELLLPPRYNEVQVYSDQLFRVNFQGKWGIVNAKNEIVIPFRFDYIAPMEDGFCVVIQNRKMGVANHLGAMVIPPKFDRIELENGKARAFIGQQLTLFQSTDDGNMTEEDRFQKHIVIKIGGARQQTEYRRPADIENPYVLPDFEWFYSPQFDRWGLRSRTDGRVQIEPAFNEIHVFKDLGLTLVGIEALNYCDFGQTAYRFEMAYGIVNNEVGLLVHEVDLIDLKISDFNDGLPAARCVFLNGRHGLINRIGKVICKDYAFIGEFHDGLARMSQKGRLSATLDGRGHNLGALRDYLNKLMAPAVLKDYTLFDRDINAFGRLTCDDCLWGYMDTLGATVVEPAFEFALDFVNEVGIVECAGKWGMVGPKGQELLPCRYDEVQFLENTGNQIIRIFQKDQKFGLIDTLGRLTVQFKYDEIGSFSEGRLAVMRNGAWGFADINGFEVIPCRFREVSNFSEGLAAVKLGSKWGYIDKQGNVEIDFQFFRAGDFKNGLAYARRDSEPFGYIDHSGQWVIEPRFTDAFNFDRGAARITERINDVKKMGLINQSGEYIVRPKYLNISTFNADGLAIVAYGSGQTRYGLMNIHGEIITTYHFREIFPFKEGLARVKLKDYYGFINKAGTLVIPAKFDQAGDFSEGLAYAKVNGKFGYIDPAGDFVIPPRFSKCMDFEDGRAVVFYGYKKGGLIDREGRFLIQPGINRMVEFSEGRGLVRKSDSRFYYITEQAQMYDGYYQDAGKFQNGVAVVKENGRWGIINQKGIKIIPPKYDHIEQFEGGFAKVQIKGFTGLTNLRGELIIQPDYEYIRYAGEGVFRVEQGDKIGYFNTEGDWIWGLSE